MKKLTTLLLVLALIFVFGQGFNPGVITAEELVVAQEDEPVSLDPHKANDGPSIKAWVQVYDNLVQLDENMELEPGLAHDWEQVDDLTWEFYLREGVKFHNGNELTADDVKFTLDRLTDPEVSAPGSFIVSFLESTEVVDEYTVRIKTKEPFAPILSHLAHPVVSILNQEAVEEAGDDYGTQVVVGTGPFQFQEWSTGDYILMERFSDYFGENAGVENLRIRPIVENTVRAIELETGGVDIAYSIAPPDETRLEAAEGITLEPYQSLSTLYLGFHAQKEPLDEVKVRKAINYAVNSGDILEFVYGGQGERASGPLAENISFHNPDLDGYEYDLSKAKELMREAGYEDGFELTLFSTEDPQFLQTAELVQSNLRELNIDVSVETRGFGDFLETTAQGEHDMFVLTWGTITGDADYGLYPLFHSSQFGSPGNRTYYENSRVDELLERGRTVADPEVRQEVYYEVQEIVVEEAPWVFILNPTRLIGVGPDVENFKPHPMVTHDLSNVTFTE
ncbi:MAG: glutathione ABC transporter substrate-binding protein [Bacillota bacterium]